MRRRHARTTVSKRPMIDRYLTLMLLLGLACATPGSVDAAALTEDEALHLGLSEPAVGSIVEGGIQRAEGERERARRWPNPVLSYQREETSTAAGTLEQYGWLSQTFDIAGRRVTRGRAAEHRVEAARAEGEDFRISRRAEIQRRFYATLLEQRRVAALEEWVSQGARVAAIVARRKQAGEVSGYDAKRIEREQNTARARLATEQAALTRNRELLVAVLGSEKDWSSVDGELLPHEPLPPVDALLERVGERPDIRALTEAVEAAELDGSAAARWWLPDITVGAGVKHVEDKNDTFSGPLVIASIPLPVLDQDQAARLDAAGREQTSRGQKALALAAARADVRALWQEASTLYTTAVEFRRSTLDGSQSLTTSAERAYEAGEMDLLALLDAHRSALEAELQALDLEMSARRARIELERVTGALR